MNDYEDLMELTDKQLWDQLPKVDGELKSDFFYELSRRSFEKSDFKSALALAEQARDVLLELKDLTSDAEIIKIYRAIGMNAHALGNTDLVISTLEKALDIAKRSNLDRPDDYSILVEAYDQKGEYQKCIDLLEWQFEKYSEIDDDLECSSCLAQISLNYRKFDKQGIALTKLDLALDFAKKSGNTNFTLLIQTYIAETLFEQENYQACEALTVKLISSFDLLNNKKLMLDMKLLKLQVEWMTDANEREVIESIKELSLQIIGDDQDAVDQRLRFEQTIINCMEHIDSWTYTRELETRKKRLADLEQLVSEEKS
jgi:tetratricopeptide (TPR) repeat protein